jgi:hypothetical protein
MKTIALLGKADDQNDLTSDITIVVPGVHPRDVQAAELVIVQLLCERIAERIATGRRSDGNGSADWTTWELRVVGANRRPMPRAAVRSS